MRTISSNILDKIQKYNGVIFEIENTVSVLQQNGQQEVFKHLLHEYKKGDMQKHCFGMRAYYTSDNIIRIKWQFDYKSCKTKMPYLSLDFLNGKEKDSETRYFFEEEVLFASSKNIVDKTDIILFVDGSAGECFTNYSGVLPTTAYKFVLVEGHEHYNSFFVCYFLLKMKGQTNFFQQNHNNTGIPHINIKNFLSQKVSFPSNLDLSEKRYLDKLLSDYVFLKNEIQAFFKSNQNLTNINRAE